MMVLRFSPVSSGLFSFRMSKTRSADAAGKCRSGVAGTMLKVTRIEEYYIAIFMTDNT